MVAVVESKETLNKHINQVCMKLHALVDNMTTELDANSEHVDKICEFVSSVVTNVKALESGDDTNVSKRLLASLDQPQATVMLLLHENLQQQLHELIFDVKLLCAQSYPSNTLDDADTVIYTSTQHQFDIEKLVTSINKEGFVNQHTGQAFGKRDKQLIKLAAAANNLAITVQEEQLSLDDFTLPSDIDVSRIKIRSRYLADTPRSCNMSRIYLAVKRAFMDVYRDLESTKQYDSAIQEVAIKVGKYLASTAGEAVVDVERIQSYVESTLMELGYHAVARSYVLYRDRKHKARQTRTMQLNRQTVAKSTAPDLFLTMPDGTDFSLSTDILTAVLTNLAEDYPSLYVKPIVDEVVRSSFKGMDYLSLKDALIMSCRCMIELHPDYSMLAAQLLKKKLMDEAYIYLTGVDLKISDIPQSYSHLLGVTIDKGIANGIINPKLQTFDLDRLSSAIDCTRDSLFTYLGIQTLYDRYFIHDNQVRYELPQLFFMRVAMGLALSEDDKDAKAIEFYNQISQFDFMSSTPTLFNSGTVKSQLSSCYLTTIPDDLQGIYGSIQDNAMLQKFAGGLGNDWTQVRGTGARIKGTNGVSSGIIPFMNVVDATAIAVNQGGKRKGAVCGYLEVWHIDIMDFVELRKNTGDERRRTHDMNTANWIPDLFMQRMMKKEDWTLFTPNEVPLLHDSYGKAFKENYEAYEAQAARGEIMSKRIPAVTLWRKMLSMVFETGHPWMTFKDPCNIRSPQQHAGVVHSSNLCTEITLNTSADEIAVCNLGSINLAQHIQNGSINKDKLAATIKTAIRMLDNVIDINYYAVKQAENSNMRHRPIGLGMMGFQDALYKLGIAYDSDAAVTFADESMELISYYAIDASIELAKERGAYQSYAGSLWDKGILPIDSIALLRNERGSEYLDQDEQCRLDWQPIRDRLKQYGIRNSNVLAIAPTATIANICGVTQSIEPTYQNLYVKSNLSGEFTVVNPSLVKDLQKRQLWDTKMVNELKLCNGSLQNITRIPAELRKIYKTAFEVDINYLVQAASRRTKWIDQSQSLNLYMAKASGKALDNLYKDAWLKGLKTTYYLRSLGATDTEKSSINDHVLNAVKTSASAQACSIDDPDCEACQ